MQILEVSGRVCVKSTEADPQLVKDMLKCVPPGIYIAIRSNNISYTDLQRKLQLKVTKESQGVWLLKTQSKEPVLPVLPKQTPETATVNIVSSHKEVQLPMLSQQAPTLSGSPALKECVSCGPTMMCPPLANDKMPNKCSNVLPFIRPSSPHVHL